MKQRYFYKDLKGNKYSFKSQHFGLIPITEEEFNVKPQVDKEFEVQRQINKLKKQLAATDYKIIKYVEGKITLVEFKEISEQRQAIRDQINQLEKEI